MNISFLKYPLSGSDMSGCLYHFNLHGQVKVLGLDLDPQKVESINSGKSYLKHFSSESIAEQVSAGRFEATTDPSRLSEVEAILICVPHSLDDHREPDLSFVLDTARTIAPHIPKGVLVTLESTTYPGTTGGRTSFGLGRRLRNEGRS